MTELSLEQVIIQSLYLDPDNYEGEEIDPDYIREVYEWITTKPMPIIDHSEEKSG